MKRLLILVMALLALTPALASAYVLDKVEAVVNGEVITRSEVDRAVRNEAVRRGISDEKDMATLRKEVLDSIIERELILGDARKFNIVDVTEEEVDAALAQVKARYLTEADFRRALAEEDMTVGELREDLAEQITVVKYIDRRVKFFVRVGIDDQKRYYSEHRDEFEGKSFNDVHESIYNILLEKYTDDKLKEYIEELRSRSDIVIVSPEAGG